MKMLFRYPFVYYAFAAFAIGFSQAQVDSTNTTAAASNGCEGPRTPGELRAKFLTGYDKFTRPQVAKALADGSFSLDIPREDVRVQLHIMSLSGVDQKRNEYELSVWLRRSWKDPQLAFASESSGGCFKDDTEVAYKKGLLDDIWSPDIYIENTAKKIEEITSAVRVYPDGQVIWSSQLLVTLACKMDFERMPFDIQKCGMRVGTWLEDADTVTMGFIEGLKPVTVASELAAPGALPHGGTPEWTILPQSTGKVIAVDGSLETSHKESEVEFQLQLERHSSYYTSFVMIPCFMFVFIGWASFFVNRGAAPARVAMSMIGFLANTNFLVAQLGQLPRLGNDAWLLRFVTMCTWFSFYSVVEYVVANYLRRVQARLDGVRKKISENAKDVEEPAPKEQPAVEQSVSKNKEEEPEVVQKEEEQGFYKGATKADIIASGFNRKIDLLLLNPKSGAMYIKDEHVDIFSRYAYPIVFAAAFVGVWYT